LRSWSLSRRENATPSIPSPVARRVIVRSVATPVVVSRPARGAGRHARPGSPMSSASDTEIAPDHWWLYRRTDDEHFVFAYEYSRSVLCHVQRTSDWLVRIDRADGTILFSQHDLRSRAEAFALAESVMELCALLHREVVTERSQSRKPMYVSPRTAGSTRESGRRGGSNPETARRPSDSRPLEPPARPRGIGRQRGEYR